MPQKLSLKLKKEFEDHLSFLEQRCSELGSSGEFENCDKCDKLKQCQATSDRLVNFFAESIK